MCIPTKWLSCLCCSPCFLHKNVEWEAKAQHLALTVDGIRYVRERHPSMCGLSCTDKRKVSEIIPYDSVADCVVEEPSGKSCCCVKNMLPIVRIGTSSTEDGVHDLVFAGLRHPNAFKQAVYTMKHSESPSNTSAKISMASGQFL